MKKLPPEMRDYFRTLGSLGGKKRAERLTAEDRKKIGERLTRARHAAALKRKEPRQ